MSEIKIDVEGLKKYIASVNEGKPIPNHDLQKDAFRLAECVTCSNFTRCDAEDWDISEDDTGHCMSYKEGADELSCI